MFAPVLSVLLGSACAAASASVVQRRSVAPPGTYEISFCLDGCSRKDASVQVRGTLVLEDRTIPSSSFSESARKYFEEEADILFVFDARRAPNACFALSRPNVRAESHIGLDPVALTQWVSRPDSGDFRVVMFHSADASYVAYLTATEAGLRGRGQSRGGGIAAGAVPDDSVYARRIGPPDPSICGRAAEARAAALRAQRPK